MGGSTDPGGSFLNGFGSGMGGCFGVVAAVVANLTVTAAGRAALKGAPF